VASELVPTGERSRFLEQLVEHGAVPPAELLGSAPPREASLPQPQPPPRMARVVRRPS
jgi:hypothetical protein